MTSPLPVVCDFLKLPPDQEIFFKIKETPTIFLDKLRYLQLISAACQNGRSCPPEARRILRDLRKAAGEQCEYLSSLFSTTRYSAYLNLKLLNALCTTVTEETTCFMDFASGVAGCTTEKSNIAHQNMKAFGSDVSAAAHQLTTILNNGRRSPFATEIPQVTADIVQATDECRTLLKKIADYYTQMEHRLQDEEFLINAPPTPQEIAFVRSRWINFSNIVGDPAMGFSHFTTLKCQIINGADIWKIEKVPRRWWKIAQPTSQVIHPRTHQPPERTTTGSDDSMAVSSPSSASTARKSPKRLSAHYIFSRFSGTWKGFFHL